MRMHSDMKPDADLDTLLGQARMSPPEAGDAFMARIMADALAAQPQPRAFAPQRARRGLFSRLAAAVGGAVALAGVGSAAMAGLVIGYVQPEPMVSLASSMGFVSVETLELFSGFDALLSEDVLQ